MTDEQQFCLRWNNFQTNITSQFEALRNEELFVDVTLACEGQRLKAHKVVLSACSPYFKELFTSNPCKHPILFMRDVEFCHLRALVEFMYAGEVNVAQAQLTAFLRTAESLHIRGLTETPRPRKEERLSPALDADVFRPDGRKVEEEGVLDASPPLSPPPSKRPCRSATPPPLQLPCRGESPDIIEPKLELPDYGSDGECRVDGSMSASMFGLDNSIDGNTSLSSLHGSMDTYPGTSSQNFMADFSQDSSQGVGLEPWRGTVPWNWSRKVPEFPADGSGRILLPDPCSTAPLLHCFCCATVCNDVLAGNLRHPVRAGCPGRCRGPAPCVATCTATAAT
ncbi:uncharacterized protein LOC134532625 isoform X4 [Bacillus rossius redtenbacheri]|uniref:uncharacterized protein LOC134532625 isoform X4 n=1 Tax=Bacillus rossius redtenbacheri TaxID=93214 RepID=UPI002FDE8284